MSNGFPCPNLACAHVFAPEAVRGAAALTCPLCGTAYRFRTGPPPPPPPPATRHPPPRPAPAVSIAPPVAARGPALDFEPSGEVVAPRRRRRRGEGGGRLALGCFVFLLLSGGAGWAI